MSKRIFRGIFFVALTVCAACLLIIMGVLYDYYSELHNDEIRNAAEYISAGVEANGEDYLAGLDKNSNRITWIASDGTVKYDSVADVNTLENHSRREEFVKAVEDGSGESDRYSDTLSKKTFYFAKRLADGSVLRVSSERFSAASLIVNMIQPIVIVIIIAVFLSWFLAAGISRSITKPINDIDFENPQHIKGYEEISPLVDRIVLQNKQINSQMEELSNEHESRDRMRREFTANVSHELKTPLTSISGFAEIIRDGLVRPDDIPRFAGNIYDEAGRLITLVDDIIKISQLDEGGLPVEKSPIDLYDVCAEAQSHLKSVAAKRGIEVTLEGGHTDVMGVEPILYEMVYNICDNAIKYNKDGGKVHIKLEDFGSYAQLSVSDTGIGIPQAECDRVFERFYRVNKSHSKEIGGTGLGLSIVKHGAAFHDAELSLKSRLGEGTTVFVKFKKA